ncbi:hypothetical protein [Promicromonospora sukumoe]
MRHPARPLPYVAAAVVALALSACQTAPDDLAEPAASATDNSAPAVGVYTDPCNTDVKLLSPLVGEALSEGRATTINPGCEWWTESKEIVSVGAQPAEDWLDKVLTLNSSGDTIDRLREVSGPGRPLTASELDEIVDRHQSGEAVPPESACDVFALGLHIPPPRTESTHEQDPAARTKTIFDPMDVGPSVSTFTCVDGRFYSLSVYYSDVIDTADDSGQVRDALTRLIQNGL